MLDKKAKNNNAINIPYENTLIELPIFSNAEITELIPPYIEPLNEKQILHSIKNPFNNASFSAIGFVFGFIGFVLALNWL